jgi:hypothetical protein
VGDGHFYLLVFFVVRSHNVIDIYVWLFHVLHLKESIE